MEEKLIRNSKATTQAVEFGGLQNGKIHPTDFDAVIEINDEILVLIEIKRTGADIGTGQAMAYTRVIDAWSSTFKPPSQWHKDSRRRKGIFIFAEHNVFDTNIDVPVENCTVNRVYTNKTWTQHTDLPETMHNLKDALNLLGKRWNTTKLKF